MFRRHFYSGFAFDSRSITLYSLLAIFNDISMTIRTKGMKDQLCVIFLANVVSFLVAWRGFAVSGRKRSWRFYFAVVISSFITFQLHTDQLFFSNFYGKERCRTVSCLPLYIAKPRNKGLKYFLTVPIECELSFTLNKLFCLCRCLRVYVLFRLKVAHNSF